MEVTLILGGIFQIDDAIEKHYVGRRVNTSFLPHQVRLRDNAYQLHRLTTGRPLMRRSFGLLHSEVFQAATIGSRSWRRQF